MNKVRLAGACLIVGVSTGHSAANAQDLYRDSNWSSLASDRRASDIGDIITIDIFQAAEASNSAQNNSHKATNIGGSIDVANISEGGTLKFGGGYSGSGEVKRSEKFVSQISVVVRDVLANGDLVIGGEQWLKINGERTRIDVRGRIRTADIRSDNSVLSSRIADAQIDYDGRGFVSRSARPGIINRIFSFLGLS